ncbi:2-oxoisovalerate dehydrogenase subunit alpha 2, mitochondrial-like [Coffea eugenioides]|uniref:2-oxoisovalerate dehydrogenase subunit alpha 2, mitochondrial-like n=1 Tax=Coffea eugenioides TaxID=49369 RepID=UPI000F6096AD|nr:2-oxoisovalerate dehydrogenase subunit alpha 2, mitochondrial-like [Coffea eugenioides]
MGFYLSKSRTVMHNLKPKLGSLGVMFHQSSGIASFSHHQESQSGLIKNLGAGSCNRPTLFTIWRSEHFKAEKQLDCKQNSGGPQVLNFPGGNVKFTSELDFLPEGLEERVHCYRILDENGELTSSNFVQISDELAVRMYTYMAMLQTMDTIFYEAQRQGRISFYVTAIGEEAINIASAAALQLDDPVFPQYRESGVLLWRGFTLQEFANQCFGNKNDNCKGRQMPAHYGSVKHNYFTVASTVATQVPHAVGAAYSLKMDRINACSITYFGDGGTSTGDFHAALNFAAVMEAPVIFFCRNNGWAISTPVEDQFRSDGIVVRGQAYGVHSIRVDGNDALAIYSAVRAARQMAITEQRPVLIEALTYRGGHHTTSDDSTRYRSAEEIEWWRVAQCPLSRFRKWLEKEGWWDSDAETELRASLRKQVLHAIQVAEQVEKPPVADIFTDVYDAPPSNLHEQETTLLETIEKHPKEYPPNFSC